MAMSEKEVLEVIEDARLDGRTTLELRGSGLTLLPAAIGELTNLTQLYISHFKLSVLPAAIGELTNLTELFVIENELLEFPTWIGQLTKLTRLYIFKNKLSSLPAQIGELTNLTHLDVGNNKFSVLPDEICQLTNLIELLVLDNQLSSLPDEIGQLTNLTRLWVSDNQLSSLPAQIGQLSNLTKLFVSDNQLSTLPTEVGELSNLTVLDVPGNQLSSLPAQIGQLTNLTDLDVRYNNLSELPDEICQLSNLTKLDVSGNALKSLPESLCGLEKLSELYLHGNDELGLPAEVLGATRDDVLSRKGETAKAGDILDYYFRARGGQRRPLNEAKLILVGGGDVGKTSLVNRLVHDYFDKDEGKTEGIKITQWPVVLDGGDEVRLHVWDFGGQEIMHSTHQFFLSQRSVYILVLNGRGGHEDSDAEYWLNLIESFGGDSPVIVVLNKIKGHPFDLNRRGLSVKYPGIRGFIETDCCDEREEPVGIEALREAIHKETDGVEGLRDAFPAEWFAIKDKLAVMEENYLSFGEYRKICARLKEKDPKAQEQLAGYLHILGIALNFKDDPRLRDMHVLNPHWVTNGIYAILNANKLNEQKGELRSTDLVEILDYEKYPSERHSFLMELMRKFELCFHYPEDDGHYLVPELLAKEQAEEAGGFVQEECLNFQYHYPVLPEGLLPRFIVRSHVLSAGRARWRTGVILGLEGCEALVKADVEEKRVYVSVRGDGGARRRLLAVIRSDFEHIHGSFKFDPVEMVPVPKYPKVVLSYNDLLVMEKDRIETTHVVIDGKTQIIKVSEMLNGVDLEGARKKEKRMDTEYKRAKVFYSYCHKDEGLRNQLETHLKLMGRTGIIDTWHDRRIVAGEEWKGEIDENLEKADIILLLVSADFIASDYCYELEMVRAMERHEAGEARVVPVIVRDVNWKKAPFAKLQALPKDAKAVELWKNRDSAWKNVSEGIEAVVREITSK